MSSGRFGGTMRIAARLAIVATLAGLLAGCFRPMYADRSADGGSALREKLLGVELPELKEPNGSRIARLGVEVRNALAFKLYGNATGMPPTHRLILRLTGSNATVMTDSVSQLPSVESYTLNASFSLVEIASGKLASSAPATLITTVRRRPAQPAAHASATSAIASGAIGPRSIGLDPVVSVSAARS